MRSFFAFTLALALAAVQPVFSKPALTMPVASTIGHGGKLLTVTWDDSAVKPTFKSWKGINIFLATGDTNTQYKLQQLATNISTNQNSGKYAVESSIGPNGGFYFIRMESVSVNTSGIPLMAFSSKFTLASMTGTFNSTVQAAASSNAAGSSASSASGTSATLTMFTSTAAGGSSSAAATTGTTSSDSATSGASTVKVQHSLILLVVATVTLAGLVVLL